jgi:hypothetical protein
VNYNVNADSTAVVPLGINGELVPIQRVACEVIADADNAGFYG